MCTVQTYGTCIGCMTFEYEYMYNVFNCLYVYKCEQSIWYVLFHVRFTFNSVKPIMHNIFMGWCFIIINGRNDLNQTHSGVSRLVVGAVSVCVCAMMCLAPEVVDVCRSLHRSPVNTPRRAHSSLRPSVCVRHVFMELEPISLRNIGWISSLLFWLEIKLNVLPMADCAVCMLCARFIWKFIDGENGKFECTIVHRQLCATDRISSKRHCRWRWCARVGDTELIILYILQIVWGWMDGKLNINVVYSIYMRIVCVIITE